MPRNPPWRREELILALDLYMTRRGSLPGKGSPAIAELSNTLNQLAASLGLVAGDKHFRNEAGVYMKLMNFLPHDPEYGGEGLRAGGKLDGKIWDEFEDDPAKLRRAAASIRPRVATDDPRDSRWRDAVLGALRRFSRRHHTRKIPRGELLAEERDRIVRETRTQGATPDQTVSRVLQELRDDGIVEFLGRGTYLLMDSPIDAKDEDLPERALDAAARRNKLRLGNVATSDEKGTARLRRGQARVRALTLDNYGGLCAFCDVTDERLLIASHICRWADCPEHRGNLANVICLCRFHDALFEAGYLSLSDDLAVLRKGSVTSRTVRSNLKTAGKFRRPSSFPPDPRFLRMHRRRTGN